MRSFELRVLPVFPGDRAGVRFCGAVDAMEDFIGEGSG